MGRPLDAAALAGLLADDDRRRCVAALELGASSSDGVATATGLPTVRVAKALGRLVAGGLAITAGDAGELRLDTAAIRSAARDALHRPATGEHDAAPEDQRKVLKAFVVDGRITMIPTAAGKRRVILDWLAQGFEPGRRYSEAMVNLILGNHHADTAALRRYMVDEGLLDRAEGHYWRSGGTIPS